jgi:hypothetical protein
MAGGAGVMWAGFLKRDYGLGTAFSAISVTVAVAGVVVLTGYFFVRRQEDQAAAAAVGFGFPEAQPTDFETSVAPPGPVVMK